MSVWKLACVTTVAVCLTACGATNGTALKNTPVQTSQQIGSNSSNGSVVNGKDVQWISYQNGHLQYGQDAQGNRIPDFSYAGFKGGGVLLPKAPVKQTVSPSGSNDDTTVIQQAIDAVGKLSIDANGLRGAVLLEPGTYHIAGTMQMNQSGVVLRGSGSGQGGTLLIAEGKTRTVLTLG
ncbi:MAG: peptidoglycan-binding protein, partial [Bacilli bacterium]|nr:peptidoglycan-binding protein [Bacilli bacterium]